MKIKFEVEFDTDNPKDLEKIEETLSNLQQVKEILERLNQNLNKSAKRNRQ
jgi:hypothetical protein